MGIMKPASSFELDCLEVVKEEGWYQSPGYPPIAINVPYRELYMHDVRRTIEKIKRFEYSGPSIENRIWLRFYGHPKYDGRQLFELIELREWVHLLNESLPHLFYYLSETDRSARDLFLSLAYIDSYFIHADGTREIQFFEETKHIAEMITSHALNYSLSVNKSCKASLIKMLQQTVSPFNVFPKVKGEPSC